MFSLLTLKIIQGFPIQALPGLRWQKTGLQCRRPGLHLGQEDLPEKEMATPSSILAWRTSWREEPSGLQSGGSQRGTIERLTLSHFHYNIKSLLLLVFSQKPNAAFLVTLKLLKTLTEYFHSSILKRKCCSFSKTSFLFILKKK